MLANAIRLTSSTACSPLHVTDILTIGANHMLDRHLVGIFQRFGWRIANRPSRAAAIEFLRKNKAAVALCQELLPDGTWRDAANQFESIPDAPALIVIGQDTAILDEALASGGVDILKWPLHETEVVWTVASAWHQWMKRFEILNKGGAQCSDA
jgi:DNA-binding NtrC family response regulator